MNSFIVVANQHSKQQEYVESFIKTHGISPFDVTTIDGEGSIGIEVVRKLQSPIYLAPHTKKGKIICIYHAENLTTEAQNAFLKILEEPPGYLSIFLCSTTTEVLLPTVLSRCTLIALTTQPLPLDTDMLWEQFEILTGTSIPAKLALAETVALQKETLPQWFGAMTQYIREKMLLEPTTSQRTKYADILHSLQHTYKDVSTTNSNNRVVLEHFFLDLDLST